VDSPGPRRALPRRHPARPPAGSRVLALAGRLPPQSREDAIDQLLEARYHYHAAGQDDQAMTAQRDDYDTAEPLYRHALDISERISDQGGTAASYHQLGTLAQDRGDYDTAEPLYRHALEILERISDQAGYLCCLWESHPAIEVRM
jgi:tetratricopeptide (TPR) repeat protein